MKTEISVSEIQIFKTFPFSRLREKVADRPDEGVINRL
jgi:hypothetical protein